MPSGYEKSPDYGGRDVTPRRLIAVIAIVIVASFAPFIFAIMT